MVLSRALFRRLVEEAIRSLPREFARRLANVEVVVEESPTPEDLQQAGVSRGGTLLGLYLGVPLSERGSGYGNVLPDKIILFQRPILTLCRSPREVREEVRKTLVHEIGHHFGLSERELRNAGVE